LHLTGVTNPQGLTWTYAYDAAGRLVAETDFNDRTLTYVRDATGRLVSRTNGAGQTVHYTRDALGRVTEQRTGEDSGVTTYAYDAAGDLIRTANRDAEITFDRDPLGRVLAETVNGRTTTYSYDLLGRRTSRTTPTGLTSTWTHDLAGRPARIETAAGSLDFCYDAAGHEIERRLGEHLALTQTWDGSGRLTAQSLTRASSASPAPAGARPPAADTLLQHRTYRYRPDDHLTEIRDLTSGTRRLTVDSMGRATGVRAPGWIEEYAYDTTGSVVRATAPDHACPGEREYSGTLLHRAGRTTYVHDAQGRLVRRTRALLNGQKHTWTYSWNAEDRLTGAVTPDGSRWHYRYDPLGRRVAKYRRADDGTETDRTDFSWDDARLAERTGPDGRATTWDYAPDTHRPLTQTDHTQPDTAPGAGSSYLARLAGETVAGSTAATRFHAVITDAAGTPSELVSASGDLVWQRHTTLWGTPVSVQNDAAGTADCPLRFPGQYADPETGLSYNHFRYYDPETARYLAPDPLGLDPAPDHHAYVPNPLSWTDPLGLAPKGPKDPINFGQGYTGREDRWSEGTKGTDFEIHVYDKAGREVGIFRSDGWFNKHGISGADVDVPPSVENAVKGRAIDTMRKLGRIGPKGTEDISGDKWKRPPLSSEGCT
jgi:RHS repeat-associated protein